MASVAKSAFKVVKNVVKTIIKRPGKVLKALPPVATAIGIISSPVTGAITSVLGLFDKKKYSPPQPAQTKTLDMKKPEPSPVAKPRPPLGVSIFTNLFEPVDTILHAAGEFGKKVKKFSLLGDFDSLLGKVF